MPKVNSNELINIRRGLERHIYDLGQKYRAASSGKQRAPLKKQMDEAEAAYKQAVKKEADYYSNYPDAAPSEWNTRAGVANPLSIKELEKVAVVRPNQVDFTEIEVEVPEKAPEAPKRDPEPVAPPTETPAQKTTTPPEGASQGPGEAFKKLSPILSLIPPKKGVPAVAPPPEPRKIRPDDYVALRHGLYRRIYDLKKEYQNASGGRQKELDSEIASLEKAYAANNAREAAYYREFPDKAAKDFGKNPTAKEVLTWIPIRVEDIPKEATKFPPGPKGETFFKNFIQKTEGGKAKDKFIQDQRKELTRDINQYDKELAALDPSASNYASRKSDIDDKREDARRFLAFANTLLKQEPDRSRFENQYTDLKKKFKDLLNPEQQEKYKRGEQIDIRQSKDPKAATKLLKDLGEQFRSRHQDLINEQKYLALDPDHSHDDWRSFTDKERTQQVNAIQAFDKAQGDTEGAQNYYNQNRTEGSPAWQDLAPQQQKERVDAFARAQARDISGVGQVPKSFKEKLLGSAGTIGGSGGEFVSKYPPELQQPLIQSALSGLEGLQKQQQQLTRQQRVPQLEQAFGKQGAQGVQESLPFLLHSLLGGRQAFGGGTPAGQATGLGISNLLGGLQQPQQQQQAPEETPQQQKSLQDIIAGLRSDLGGVLQNGNQ